MEMQHSSADKPTLLNSLLPSDNAEKKLWKRLRHHQLGVLFRRRYRLGSERADFYCPEAALVVVVEIEDIENNHPSGQSRTEDARFRRFGLETLRFTESDILYDIDHVVVEIFRSVHRRLEPSASLA